MATTATVTATSNQRSDNLDDLVVALVRWLDAADAIANGAEQRLAAIEEARHQLASCVESVPLGMRPAVRRGWARAWAV